MNELVVTVDLLELEKNKAAAAELGAEGGDPRAEDSATDQADAAPRTPEDANNTPRWLRECAQQDMEAAHQAQGADQASPPKAELDTDG